MSGAIDSAGAIPCWYSLAAPVRHCASAMTIEVTVMAVNGSQVRIGIKAPRNVAVDREEIAERKQRDREALGAGRETRRGETDAIAEGRPRLGCRSAGASVQLLRVCRRGVPARLERNEARVDSTVATRDVQGHDDGNALEAPELVVNSGSIRIVPSTWPGCAAGSWR